MRRSLSRLTVALLLGGLGLIVLAACTQSAAPHDYQQVLDQPCVSCHPGGNSTELNARGQAFTAAANHKADPQSAWTAAVQAVPLPPSSGDGASVLVPIAVVALLVAWLYTMLRRRRPAT